MEDYILISTLNDYIFCPYSIYLHNVYMNCDEDVFHAEPMDLPIEEKKGITGF